MLLAQQNNSPLNRAVVDYCRSFLGRSLLHAWQALPAIKRGRGKALQPLKQGYFDRLAAEFTGESEVAIELKTLSYSCSETLDRLEMSIVRSCSEACVESIVAIHKSLNSSCEYNELAFDPRNLVAYLILAAEDLNIGAGTKRQLYEAYVKDLGRRIELFYGTLREVVESYCVDDLRASSLANNCDRLSHSKARQQRLASHVVAGGLNAVNHKTSAGTPSKPLSGGANELTEYVDRFYASKIYTHSASPQLYAVFQSAYAYIVCYAREGLEADNYKSEIIRQVLQELYELTKCEAEVFDQYALHLSRLLECWASLEMGLWSSLRTICDQLIQVKKTINARQPPNYKDKVGAPAEAVEPPLRSASKPDYAKTSYIYNCTQSIVSAALEETAVPQISAFIDHYWRHALLVAGLQTGVESREWNEALKVLQELCNITCLADAGPELQDVILIRLRAVGLHFLSYNDFLERESYSGAAAKLFGPHAKSASLTGF